METRTILVQGKIRLLVGEVRAGGAAVSFRLGGLRCRATTPLAEQIVERRGYPAHEVRVVGRLQEESPRKKVLAIESLELVD